MARKERAEINSMSDQAIEWIILLHSGKATGQDKRAAEQWRQRSQAHAQAFSEAESLWNDMGELLIFKGVQRTAAQPRSEKLRQWPVFSRNGAIGLAVLLLLFVIMPWARYQDQWLSDYYTDVGVQRSIELADGSTVELDTDTALAVHYDDTGRQIRLLRGQALFTVKADALRPFDVNTGSIQIRALGTVFSVRQQSGDTRVTVLEHAVSMKQAEAGVSSEEIRVWEGQQAAYNTATGLSEPQPADIGQISAWRRGKLVFKNRALADVVTELERYLPGRIVITNNDIGALQVSGVFPIDEPEEALAMIGQILPVEMTQLSPWLTVLHY